MANKEVSDLTLVARADLNDPTSFLSVKDTNRVSTDNDVRIPITVFETLKNKLDATVPPGVTNDGTEGYSVGSKWVDVANDKVYFVVDISTGAAVWLDASGGGGGGGGGSYNPVEARMLQRRVSSSAAASDEAAAPEAYSLIVPLGPGGNGAEGYIGSLGSSYTRQFYMANGNYVAGQFVVPSDWTEFTEAFITFFTFYAATFTYDIQSSGGATGDLYTADYATETGRSFVAVSGSNVLNIVDISDYLNAHATAGEFMSLVIKSTSNIWYIGTNITLKWQ
jgi:hypothetical protein